MFLQSNKDRDYIRFLIRNKQEDSGTRSLKYQKKVTLEFFTQLKYCSKMNMK